MTVTLPNVRKLFIPDPGYTIFEADLSGADALVVAAESDDRELISSLTNGYDLHSENAAAILGRDFTSLPLGGHARDALRQQFKSGVHGTNYGAAARTLAQTFGWPVYQAEKFQSYWFGKHPGVRRWHETVKRSLTETRSVSNRFGYRIHYFDRIDSVFTQALAWIPQSTVAEVCFRGALSLESQCPCVEMLLQVHDSLVFQIPTKLVNAYSSLCMRDALLIPVPYATPLIIPWKFSKSEKSWGDCEKFQI